MSAERPLVGTDWRLAWMGGKALAPLEPGRVPWLRFDGSRVAGSDGCNRIGGGYTLDGHGLIFGPLVGTQMACATGMDEARAFADALARVRAYALRGDALELIDAAGVALLRLQARDPALTRP